MQTLAKKEKYSEFLEGLLYPWRKMGKLWNILWLLIPIIGWLAILGYVKKIVNELVKGKNKGLPEFGKFGKNLVDGFWIFIKFIPWTILIMVISRIPQVGGLINTFIYIFILPYLTIHFFVTGKFEDLFAFKKVANEVFNNIKEYFIAFLKTIGFGVIYYALSLVLIGIPCLTFGSYYYLAEFYAKHK